MKLNVALVGVTGMVGQKFLEVLEEKKLPVKNYYFFASNRSAGKKLLFNGKEFEILELNEENIRGKKIDYALFSIEAELSREFAPLFAKEGAKVIDNSSEWRMHKEVPLVVPEVNIDAVHDSHGIIANPNCSTIEAALCLMPLHKKFGIKRIVYSTYQAVSGAGQKGYDDLFRGAAGFPPLKFPHEIYNNILPHIDTFEADGYTKEEHKMINETRKILGDTSIKVTATTVRVPVANCHSESVNVEFKKPCSLEEVRSVLEGTEGIIVIDDPTKNEYPMPILANGKDDVFVGRIRIDPSVKSGVNLWIVADNLRKGAASNAVQIMEALIKRGKKKKN